MRETDAASAGSDGRLQGIVLLVDDELEVVASLSRFLTRQFPALRVITAKDGPDALDIMETVAPDIVLTDYVMPGMSGLALLGAVHTRQPATFRILLSGYATSDTYTQALRAGTVDLLLQKPTDTREVARALRRGLEACKERRAHPTPALQPHGDVLIVGEGALLEEVLEEHFRATTADVRVRAAPSAGAALEALDRRPADVILADARLPDMAGADFLARAHTAFPKARTVLVANRSEPHVPREARPGVDRTFVKPVDLARFTRTIEKLLPHAPPHDPEMPPWE